LSLRLRDFDFESKQPLKFWIVDSEKSNRPTNQAVNPAEARFAGEEEGAYKIQVFKVDQLVGTYWMAKDRLHVMTRYESADGSQKYELKSLDRVNYWTIKKEQPAASKVRRPLAAVALQCHCVSELSIVAIESHRHERQD
jgi:hypothetical protein